MFEDAKEWYQHGVGYWEKEENCEASNVGVLGGFAELHDPDVMASLLLLQKLKEEEGKEREEEEGPILIAGLLVWCVCVCIIYVYV